MTWHAMASLNKANKHKQDTSVETNIRIIRIFEYFFPNNTIRIRIRPILKSRIIFEYSNKCSEYSEYFFRVFTGKNQNEKCKNGRLQQPK